MSLENENNPFNKEIKQVQLVIKLVVLSLIVVVGALFTPFILQNIESNNSELVELKESTKVKDEPKIVDGIDIESGFIAAEGFEIVKINCTRCHSSKLVTQNRATREGWLEMIRWMQATQGLWQLGDNEVIILDYLEKNYAPKNEGRRKALPSQDWYILK